MSAESCRGSWVAEPWVVDLFTAPDHELSRLAAYDRAGLPTTIAPRPPPRCVRCASAMERQLTPSGLAVHVCARHGLWFDAGELDVFLRYVTST